MGRDRQADRQMIVGEITGRHQDETETEHRAYRWDTDTRP